MSDKLLNVARQAAIEGAVLLENKENALPLGREEKIALLGNGNFRFLKGGGGSADVACAHTVDLVEGLRLRGASMVEKSLEKQENYDLERCNTFAKESACAVISIRRFASEGEDKKDETYELDQEERALLETVEQSDFKKVIVLLNTGAIINVASIMQFSKVKAVLFIGLSGMEGGNAVCDLLYGDQTPSGKLTDTIASQYQAYPSSKNFRTSPDFVRYDEGIFVGYRYFETKAKAEVAYPFGYGLSYTEFKYENVGFEVKNGTISVCVRVTNVGDYAGKEVVQIYTSSPQNSVEKPSVELRAFAKTRLLQPSETQTLTLTFAVEDMTYFHEEKGAYVLDKGIYQVYVGKNARDLVACGTYTQAQEKTVFHACVQLVDSDGERKTTWAEEDALAMQGLEENVEVQEMRDCASARKNAATTLYDVADGKLTLDAFVQSLTVSQLVDMTMGRPPAIIRGTGGIGDVFERKIPSSQTSDGPAGVRSTEPTHCFPCATVLACSWNEDIIFQVGAAIGEDALDRGVDIMLAPGLNIHRDPLCGRNFEYYSEDPLVSGKSAAAMVRGMQSKGIGATIKHFALNNKEENRHESNSIVGERAFREIYLKGFEIAIKESNPWCVMTSYNLINGVRAAMNEKLIRGVLRKEWGYEGTVMTDWRVHSHLWQEIKAGSNVKMPFGYPEEIQMAKNALAKGMITREMLEESAKYVLKTVLKAKRFEKKYFGETQPLSNVNVLDFCCVESTYSGSQVEKDGRKSLTGLSLDPRGNEVYVDYRVDNKESGTYVVKIEASVSQEGQRVEIYVDEQLKTQIECNVSEYDIEVFSFLQSQPIFIEKGVHTIRFYVRGAQKGRLYPPPDTIHLIAIAFEKV